MDSESLELPTIALELLDLYLIVFPWFALEEAVVEE